MKKNILIALLGIFASCQDERLELKEKDLSTSQWPANKSARVIPEGYVLQWNGDGRWFGSFAGATVWFYGPSPTQLDNGYQGDWDVTCQPSGPCMNNGYTASGNVSFFTVYAPACMPLSTSSIDIPTMSALYISHPYVMIPWSVTWGTTTRTVKSFSSEGCSIEAYGKIIVNEDCRPTIVDYTSSSVSLCPAVYLPTIE